MNLFYSVITRCIALVGTQNKQRYIRVHGITKGIEKNKNDDNLLVYVLQSPPKIQLTTKNYEFLNKLTTYNYIYLYSPTIC